jgi:hypothetical protein
LSRWNKVVAGRKRETRIRRKVKVKKGRGEKRREKRKGRTEQ